MLSLSNCICIFFFSFLSTHGCSEHFVELHVTMPESSTSEVTEMPAYSLSALLSKYITFWIVSLLMLPDIRMILMMHIQWSEYSFMVSWELPKCFLCIIWVYNVHSCFLHRRYLPHSPAVQGSPVILQFLSFILSVILMRKIPLIGNVSDCRMYMSSDEITSTWNPGALDTVFF